MLPDRSSDLLIGTRNAGKLQELRTLLAPAPVRLHSLSEFSDIADVAETGATFAENAELKATGYASQTHLWTLADDSGLEVDALSGAPGVFSARYCGENATDSDRIARLLQDLDNTGDEKRRARFVCAIAVADPAGRVAAAFAATCEGHITRGARGQGGFGYDPIFQPDGYAQTFGELPPRVKDRMSHRGRALEAAYAFLIDEFQAPA
jgi:XTP/dITP diphosphohydrolase